MTRDRPLDISRPLATSTLVVGIAALLSWVAPDPRWHGMRFAGAGVHPLTALSLIASSIALLLLRPNPQRSTSRRLGIGLAALATAIGLLRLAAPYASGSPHLERMLRPVQPISGAPVLIAGTTGLCCALIGFVLILLAWDRDRLGGVRQSLSIVVLGLATVAVLGYAFGAVAMHGQMSLATALSLISLAIACIWATPSADIPAALGQQGPAGVMVRRVLLPVILLPVVLGWLHLLGQPLGVFDDAGGTAIAVTLCILGLGTVAVWGSGRVSAAEQATEESDQRHRLLFDSSPLPSWVFDVETLRFLEVNQAAVQMYGYSPEEFLSMTLADIRAPEEVPRLLHSLQTSDQQDPPVGIWQHRRKDGGLLQVEITRREMTYAGRPARLVLANNVTERLRLQSELKGSEEHFRALALTANDAILSADQAGCITYLNPAAERMFGLERETAMGQSLTQIMPESYRARHLAGMNRYLATGQATVLGRTVELAGLRRTGEEFPIELSLASWSSAAGAAFTAIIRDITTRKQAEEALRRYASELDSANQELDAFAYSVSHDLRAPLRSIDGFSQALAEDCADGLNEEGRAHLRRIRRAAQRMGNLIDDLLVLSRLSRAPMNSASVDLTALAQSIREDLEQRDPARTARWSIAKGLVVRGDARLLRVAFENLLENAWKYTRNTPEPHVVIGSRTEQGQTVFFVQDNGAGFDMRYRDKLFVPFQRLHSEAEFEGTGIGLATVARVVHRHGGRVWATGEPGLGATFSLSLEGPSEKGVLP